MLFDQLLTVECPPGDVRCLEVQVLHRMCESVEALPLEARA
jgi:hypothetical protein